MNETGHKAYSRSADLGMLQRGGTNKPEDGFDSLLSCVSTFSNPSNLKITDIKFAFITGAPMPCPLIRIETNQGICGYGEVRDHSSPVYALMLKRILLGENPCNIDKIFRRIKQFGAPSRQAGGVSAIEIALWDIAGKAYGVPVYQMLGGRFRDRIRMYCDTHVHGKNTGRNMGRELRERRDAGYTLLKMNLNIALVMDEPGAICAPLGLLEEFSTAAAKLEAAESTGDREGVQFWRNRNFDVNGIMHPYLGIQITEKGLDLLEQYVADVRAELGNDIPLAIDHVGHVTLESGIHMAKRLEKYNLAWLEDMLPWQLTEQYAKLRHSTSTPIATGEDIYLKEGFKPLLEAGGVSLIQPDILTSGGILENKKIGDLAQEYGVPMAVHMAETPVGCLAAVHSVAATENFLALEFHSNDVPWWDDIIESSLPKPLVQHGFITVPDTPGLGIDTFNDEVLKAHAHPDYPQIWASTEEWDKWFSRDRQWS